MSVLKIKNANNEWESVPVINGEDGVIAKWMKILH